MNAKLLDLSTLLNGRRYVIISDVHSCSQELEALLAKVNFDSNRDILISGGDNFDRGPFPLSVLNYCMLMQSRGLFYGVMGNHDDKLLRYLKGGKVKIKNGLQGTIDAFESTTTGIKVDKDKLIAFLESFHHVLKVPEGYVVHAGFNPTHRPERQMSQDCLYMRYFGGKDFFDNINGRYWYEFLPNDYPNTFSGHEVHPEKVHVRAPNAVPMYVYPNDYLLDGGCVFGGELRLWDSKDKLVHTIQAIKNYTDKETIVSQERRLAMLEEARKEYYQIPPSLKA